MPTDNITPELQAFLDQYPDIGGIGTLTKFDPNEGIFKTFADNELTGRMTLDQLSNIMNVAQQPTVTYHSAIPDEVEQAKPGATEWSSESFTMKPQPDIDAGKYADLVDWLNNAGSAYSGSSPGRELVYDPETDGIYETDTAGNIIYSSYNNPERVSDLFSTASWIPDEDKYIPAGQAVHESYNELTVPTPAPPASVANSTAATGSDAIQNIDSDIDWYFTQGGGVDEDIRRELYDAAQEGTGYSFTSSKPEGGSFGASIGANQIQDYADLYGLAPVAPIAPAPVAPIAPAPVAPIAPAPVAPIAPAPVAPAPTAPSGFAQPDWTDDFLAFEQQRLNEAGFPENLMQWDSATGNFRIDGSVQGSYTPEDILEMYPVQFGYDPLTDTQIDWETAQAIHDVALEGDSPSAAQQAFGQATSGEIGWQDFLDTMTGILGQQQTAQQPAQQTAPPRELIVRDPTGQNQYMAPQTNEEILAQYSGTPVQGYGTAKPFNPLEQVQQANIDKMLQPYKTGIASLTGGSNNA
jgi:hypothetical protein